MRILQLPLLVTALTFTFGSCSKDSEPESEKNLNPFANLSELSRQTKDGVQITVYGKGPYFSGYNELLFDAKDEATGESIKNFDLKLTPIMDMGEYSHSCPVEQPTLNQEGLMRGAAVFQMPSMNGTWKLMLSYSSSIDNKSTNFDIDISVENPEYTRTHVLKSPIDGKRIILSLVENDKWLVGDNKFEITAHSMRDMMNFDAEESMRIEIEPEMPSMGHGSEGNSNPIHTNNGHYEGNLALNMPGDWRIHINLYDGDSTISQDKLYYDIYFQN